MSDAEQLWSVEIVIGDNERAAMEYAAVRVVGPHDYMVVRPWAEGEGPSTVHIDVRAATPPDAAVEAKRVYAEMRELGQLPPDDEPNVVTVGKVVGVVPEPDRFIMEAQDLAEEKRFGMAVIA